MARKRKPPRLRKKQGCFVTDIYKADSKRTTISFGSIGKRTEGEIYAAFGKWLDLFSKHPHRALISKDPYAAISSIVNPTTIVTIGDLLDKYIRWAEGYLLPLRDGRTHPDLIRVRRLIKFMEPYREWSISDFGPDELKAVQDSMVAVASQKLVEIQAWRDPHEV